MSYCRFSSDYFRCDVYAYAHVYGGFSVSIAGRRRVWPSDYPSPPSFDSKNLKPYFDYQNQLCKDMDAWPWRYLGLSRDGQQFHCDTLAEFQELIASLRAEGYTIPQDCYDSIMAETDENPPPAPGELDAYHGKPTGGAA